MDWNTGDKSGLVDVGTTQLWLQVCGPDRIPDQPVVLIIHGIGCCAASWAAVIRYLRPHVRVVVYDRAGLGRSKYAIVQPNTYNILQDLRRLLEVTHIAPPYLLVAHCWGGVLAQQLIATSPPSHFSGLVLVEANNEHTLQLLDWRDLIAWTTRNGINYAKAIQDDNSCDELLEMEVAEYQRLVTNPTHRMQVSREHAEYGLSFRLLAERGLLRRKEPLLGNKPVTILIGTKGRHFQMVFNAALSMCAGTPDEIAYFEKFVDEFAAIDKRLQREATRLSTVHCVIQGPENSGHAPHMFEPSLVADLVRANMDADVRLNADSCPSSSSSSPSSSSLTSSTELEEMTETDTQ